ncbi:MAG: insulinase family protein [Deferribacteraceae bacterium]|jgi:predicted Zn-dependent peptidase|nr:insulinase family protein [Deferribacteraceae bacterium]
MIGQANAADSETFSNGARWKSISRDYTNTVSLVVFIKGGLFRETEANNGVGNLWARTWIKDGELLEKIEFVGGGVSAGLANDYAEFSMSVPTEYLDEVLPALRKQILSPTFTKAVFEKEKDLALRELEAEKDDPNSLAYLLFNKATYKDHPYALKTDGTQESVTKLKLKDVEKYYNDNFYAADMIIAMAGRFTTAQEKAVKDIFKDVKKGKAITLNCAGADIAKIERTEATDPRIQQAKLYLAYAAPSADSKDYMYTKILSEILGGGMSSPYFTALRKEKGYAYSVGTMYPSRLCSSRFIGYIGLQEENVDDAITTMQQLNKSVAKVVTEAELEKTKNHIIGQILYEAETNGKNAWYAAFFENLGLGFDHLDRYVKAVREVKKSDIEGVSKLFDTPHTIFVYKPAK